jgi:hypothetical protein
MLARLIKNEEGHVLRKYSTISGSWARHCSAEFMKQVLPMLPRPRVPGSSVLVAEEEELVSDPRPKPNGEEVRGDEERWPPILAKKPSPEGKSGPSGTVSVTAVSSGGGSESIVGDSTSQPRGVLNSTTKASPCMKPASSRVRGFPSTFSHSYVEKSSTGNSSKSKPAGGGAPTFQTRNGFVSATPVGRSRLASDLLKSNAVVAHENDMEMDGAGSVVSVSPARLRTIRMTVIRRGYSSTVGSFCSPRIMTVRGRGCLGSPYLSLNQRHFGN